MVTFQQQPDNPFGLIRVVSDNVPTFADIDGDGDLDAFIGEYGGNTLLSLNTGSPTSPSFASYQVNLFGLKDVGSDSHPTFVDIDADGDLDAFIGERGGNTFFFRNVDNSTNPIFAPPSASFPNPFGLSRVRGLSAPTFADIDADGDLDAFIGELFGNTLFFRNTGTPTRPNFFNDPQYNPFGLSKVGLDSSPTFADIDKDGDLDAFIGESEGNTLFSLNTGSSTNPNFATPQANPFGLGDVGGFSSPTFADINSDWDLDAFIGAGDGNINYFLNTTSVGSTPPLSGAGDQKQFTIASGDGTVDISSFGGVGQGVNPMVTFQQQPNNPFGLSRAVSDNSPTFADIDGDGDLDAFVGEYGGNTLFFQNTGSPTSPNFFNTRQVNPFGLKDVGSDSHPTFADIDGDGDLDAFIGERGGNTFFFRNIATSTNPIFAPPSAIAPNPLGLSRVGGLSAPTFADIDADGDLDAFIGELFGNAVFFRNTGTPTRPSFFGNPQDNPFGLSKVELDSSPIFADIDKDGDLDAFIGESEGNTLFSLNTGSSTNPNFTTPQANPFGLGDVGGFSSPTFADIDSDGDLDAFIGAGDGNINYFLNTTSVGTPPPLSGAGGQQQFTIASGGGTIDIINFGGVGQGVNPAAAVLAEVDTLQFTGADLTPEKLLLTTLGNNLEVSFEGVADTKVVLGNLDLEDLDNLTQDTGAAVDLGNILFDGQSEVADSFDILNADQQREQVFHRNSVTFLNDLDNTIKGFNSSKDVINGQGGNDRISGRSGDDLLRGGDGVDRLRGGKGDDLLDGGLGNDLFVLAANRGTDIVQDFNNGSDLFGLAGGLTFGQLTIAQSSGNTLISVTATNEILASLTGVNANQIRVEDFLVFRDDH